MGLFACLPFRHKSFLIEKALNKFVFKCWMLCKLVGGSVLSEGKAVFCHMGVQEGNYCYE